MIFSLFFAVGIKAVSVSRLADIEGARLKELALKSAKDFQL